MITRTTLPSAFRPYGSLNICSNLLLGGGHLVALGEVLPVVLGSGEQPMVWLQAPVSPTSKEFVLLVEASVSKHPAVTVVNGPDGLVVTIGTTIALRVKQPSPDAAIIDALDLRPIGLNIFGNNGGLTAGGAKLSGNTFSGVGTLLAFGSGPSQETHPN